jgi:hypothetical protein
MQNAGFEALAGQNNLKLKQALMIACPWPVMNPNTKATKIRTWANHVERCPSARTLHGVTENFSRFLMAGSFRRLRNSTSC